MRSRLTSYRSGLFGEFLARWFLRFHGFRILHNRYITGRNTGRAEIDIIARRGNLIVFIEVKRRPNIDSAWDAISPTQSHRLRRAAEGYIARHGFSGNARFDVIIVTGLKIHWIQGAI